jgi:hypothetical protein
MIMMHSGGPQIPSEHVDVQLPQPLSSKDSHVAPAVAHG